LECKDVPSISKSKGFTEQETNDQTDQQITVHEGGPADLQLEISAKSYIMPADCSQICIPDSRWVDIATAIVGGILVPTPYEVCQKMAAAFCLGMGPMGVRDDADEEYGNSGKFRLWSRMTFSVTCEDGHVTAVSATNHESHTGMEGPLQAPDGSFIRTVSQVTDGKGYIGYQFMGRPPPLLEPSFQMMRPRNCPYIWHAPMVEIDSCSATGWGGYTYLGGSNFPTRRVWTNSDLQLTVPQDDISALWQCSASSNTMVAGSLPPGFPT